MSKNVFGSNPLSATKELVKTISRPRQNNFPILKKDFSAGMYLYRVHFEMKKWMKENL
ncbi:MAG: hypothetical protein H0W62_02705 [Chitinophagales bacterium]|nr:hypothetical protein [Chitinophagales bacterium]